MKSCSGPMYSQAPLEELAEILAGGYLRILLSESENNVPNTLKRLDKPEIARDELEE